MRVDRLNAIEQYVLKKERVSLDELANEFHFSINTIRRDLEEIVQRGLIKKVYGGVTACFDNAPLTSNERNIINTDQKTAIGRAAAELVDENTAIFLDSGTTTERMIYFLGNCKKKTTILTHSLTVMYSAAKYRNLQVIALGGLYNSSTSSFVGMSSINLISEMIIDKTFIAATGVSISDGLSCNTYLEAELKRKVVGISKDIILLADQSKFNHSAIFPFSPLANVSHIITDTLLEQDYLNFFKEHSIDLIIAKV